MALFRLNPNLARELSQMPGFAEEIAKAAEPAREHAERFAGDPWMPRRGVPRQIEIVTEDGEVFLANLDHAGHLKEFGSRNNSPTAPLRRGVQAAGLKLGGD